MKTSKILVNLMCIGSILAKVASLPAFAGGIGYETEYPLEILSSDYYDQEVDWNLWDKFLKYDLCITDYDALTVEEQELCKFIFETERSATGTIRCERARRTLAGDENIGERLTLEQLENAYGIWDNYSVNKVGNQGYIHCVPDIKCLDGWDAYNEYWIDDNGTTRVRFTGENLAVMSEIEVLGEGNYTIDPLKMPEFENDGTYYMSDEYLEHNGDYYYIKSDNTVVFAKSQYAKTSMSDEDEPITETVVVPDEINGYPVTAIEREAFMYASVTEVVLPDSIEFIDENAFGNCQYLEKINLPENLKYMGMYAFAGSGISEIEINCPHITVPMFAFTWCNNLTDVTLNVKAVGEKAFRGCANLKNVEFGNMMNKISADAFYNCGAIENIQLPANLKIIGTAAFAGATEFGGSGIKSITIPPTVELLGALPRATGEAPTSVIYVPSTDPLTDEPVCVFDTDCVINGWYNTEAHRYALEWGLKFNPMDEDVAYGDTNLDGEISMADMVLLQSYLKGNISEIGYEADLMEDGIIDAFDMIRMRKMMKN